ncbi:MAG: ribosome recycling factor, partial [Lactobacillus iners]|nr:ribosome recycling factor [Lactobacillus iners]
LKKQQKDGEITEDDLHKFEKDIQKITDDATKDVDALADKKSKEITKA